MQWPASKVRETFLRYFEQQGHSRVHSSSLLPANDPTLLFTNAGMNQFKDVFLGLEKRDYSRAATSQKCVRAGGKHNDLENVGFTNRHHTFFEMLGNFSFGDYFKREAIAYAWELITSEKWFGIAKDRLYATIFKGEGAVPRDDEAEKYWREVGVPKERIFAMGMKDNFWAMGDTGPCGPCSEMHYDMGAEASDKKHPECAAGKCKFPCPHDCGRYMEIWNLVFMQFERNHNGELTPLPKPSIDTGMGLERISAVLQGVISNYETDLFMPLISRAEELVGEQGKFIDENNSETPFVASSLRVVADHSRAATFLISDGIFPSNEGRGYVLRKILRRAIRHGRLLGQPKPFMHEMVYAVSDVMKDAYPELTNSADRIARIVESEERRFSHTISVGLAKLDELISNAYTTNLKTIEEYLVNLDRLTKGQITQFMEQLKSGRETDSEFDTNVAKILGSQLTPVLFDELHRRVKLPPKLSGEGIFRLYDTFGLPLDFIADICRDAGVDVDQAGFDRAMEEQRERAKASWKGGAQKSAAPVYRDLSKTVFDGYVSTESRDCEVLAILRAGQGAQETTGTSVRELRPGEEGEVVLDHTPFYADSGGQVGDHGWFYDSSRTVVAEVTGCVMPVQGVRAHKVIARQPIHVGPKVDAAIDVDFRLNTMRNHTATHLLHAALRETLGAHVKQAGSLVAPSHLRFDFSHFTGVADEELQDIEDLVNKEVLKNTAIEVIKDVPLDVAINEYKAMALFGEKYGDKVRVVKIGDFSTELCGGTHTAATGEIGLVKLLHESSVSSGVRRLEAITGHTSLQHFREDHELERAARNVITTEPATGKTTRIAERFAQHLQTQEEEIKRLRRELEQLRMKSASASVSAATDQVKTINGVKVLAQRVDNIDRNQMRVLVDNLRNKLGSGVVVLGSVSDGRVALICGVTKDLTSRVQAGKVIGSVAQKVGGSGGGRPDMAEAGGKDPGALDHALASVPEVVRNLTG